MNADAANQFLGAVFGWTWRTSFHASVLIALVWLIQRTGGKWLSPRSRYALGILVLVRLLLPAVPASPWSIFNLRKAVLPRSTSPEIQVVSPSVTSATTAPAAFGSQIGPSEKAVAAGRKVDWANVGPVVWVLGLALSLAAVLAEHRKFARRINADPRIGDELILSLLAKCRSVMGVRRQINVVRARQLGTPALFGFFKPRLLLPENAEGKLDDRELRMVFLHELAHVKQADILLNWVMIFARSLHWFNPLVWLAMQHLRADREVACDAIVMSRLGANERPVYGSTLIKLLDDSSGATAWPSLAPVLNHKTEIKRRVIMIAKYRPVRRFDWTLSAMLTLALCCLTFTRAAEKQSAARITISSAPEAVAMADAVADSETGASGAGSLKKLKKGLDDLNARIHEAEKEVDSYRKELKISSVAASDQIEGVLGVETARRLESARIEMESNYKGQSDLLAQLKELKAQGGEKLRRAILTATYDPPLGKLLEDLWATEATLAKLKQTQGPEHPEFKSLAAMQADIDKKVHERIEGILSGMEAKVSATRAQLDSLSRAIEEARIADAEAGERYRPYFRARRDLENLERVRDRLYQKILEMEYGVEEPKTSGAKP